MGAAIAPIAHPRARAAGALVVQHQSNRGTGMALNSGFRAFSPRALRALSFRSRRSAL